jgi:hypothetical protein
MSLSKHTYGASVEPEEVKLKMKSIFLTLASTGLLMFGAAASMQAAPQEHGGYYQQRENFYHGQGWRTHMFDRIRDDLNYVQQNDFHGADQFRLATTKDELNDLQSKLASGGYDQPELDRVINRLQRVVAANDITPRNRDMLNDDLSRLREYRAHHENWR